MFKFSPLVLAGAMISSTLIATVLLAAPMDTYQGKIAGVGEKSVTLVTRQGENLTFIVESDCTVTLDGKPVGIGMLGIGNTASIVASLEGNVRSAKRIDVRSLE